MPGASVSHSLVTQVTCAQPGRPAAAAAAARMVRAVWAGGGRGSLRWMNGKIAAPEEEVTSSGPRNGFKL